MLIAQYSGYRTVTIRLVPYKPVSLGSSDETAQQKGLDCVNSTQISIS